MNPRIFAGAAVAAVAVVIAVVAFSGQDIINDTTRGGFIASPQNPPLEIIPLAVDLEDLRVVEIDERAAIIDIKLKVSNPNQRAVILQLVKYHLFEGDLRIHAGQIGDRFEGFVEGSNFYTVLAGSHTVLSDRITLRNTGDTPRLWDILAGDGPPGTPDWLISGEGYFNLSSMTAGGENSFTFQLRP